MKYLADQDLNNNRIHNLGDPVSAQDAATMAWVLAQVQGQDWKNSARAATTAALPTNTRTGNVLTASANGALPLVDAVALSVNDSVLVKNEVLGANNGVYTVTSLGAAGSPWVLTRRNDADTSAKVTASFSLDITEGATYTDKSFTLTTDDPIVLNTTALSFSQGPASITYLNGLGLLLSGNTFAIDPSVVARSVTGLIGDGTSTSVTFTHNLNKQWVTAQLFDASSNARVETDVVLTSANAVRFTVASAPATNAFRAVVAG